MKTIRQLRQEQGWTQFELALQVSVQPQTVYLWESGRRLPQVTQLRKLGQLFGICSDEITLEPLSDSPLRRRTGHTPAGAHASRRPAAVTMVAPTRSGHEAAETGRDDPEAALSTPGVTPSSPVRCIDCQEAVNDE